MSTAGSCSARRWWRPDCRARWCTTWSTQWHGARSPCPRSICCSRACCGDGAAKACAWLYQRRRADATATEGFLTPFIFAWGTLWWLVAGWREIDRWLAPDLRLATLIGLLTVTALAFALVERRLVWPIARIPALALL